MLQVKLKYDRFNITQYRIVVGMDFNTILKILNEEIDLKVESSENIEEKKAIEKKEPLRPKRCQHEGCKVKLMLADFACRCSGFYCSQHRFSEAHKCRFDYKGKGLDTLAKQMQAVIGVKVNKI